MNLLTGLATFVALVAFIVVWAVLVAVGFVVGTVWSWFE